MRIISVIMTVGRDFLDDEVLTRSAALSFYTALSLPPILVLLVWGLGNLSDGAESYVESQAAQFVGPEAERLVGTILSSSDRRVTLGGVTGWVGLGALLFAASGVFTQLQAALNRVWKVRARPGGGLKLWARKRFLSLGLVGVLAFLLAVSLIASTALEAVDIFREHEGFSAGIQIGSSLIVFTLLFAAVFKFLPDVDMTWRDVFGGAFITALLFSIAKYFISLYLATKGLEGDYGAAGSAIAVLAWVYLSGAVLLTGAEITQAWVKSSGRRIGPNRHAEWLKDGELSRSFGSS